MFVKYSTCANLPKDENLSYLGVVRIVVLSNGSVDVREVPVGGNLKYRESSEVKFEEYQEELLQFLARRFGSIALAERIGHEMKERIAESDMLTLVGNPRVYLSSYGVSLGRQYLQEELSINPHHKEIF